MTAAKRQPPVRLADLTTPQRRLVEALLATARASQQRQATA